MAEREEKLKAARDKLDKFRKKKNSARTDGSVSPFPTTPLQDQSINTGGGGGGADGLAAYFGQQNDSFSAAFEGQQQTPAADKIFTFDPHQQQSGAEFQQQATAQQQLHHSSSAFNNFQQQQTSTVISGPQPIPEADSYQQQQQRTSIFRSADSFEQQQSDAQSIQAAYSGLSQYVPSSELSQAIHASQREYVPSSELSQAIHAGQLISSPSGHFVTDDSGPTPPSEAYRQHKEQQHLQHQQHQIHQREQQLQQQQNIQHFLQQQDQQVSQIGVQDNQNSQVDEMVRELEHDLNHARDLLVRERELLAHERDLLAQERSQRELLGAEVAAERGEKEALVAEVERIKAENSQALSNISEQTSEVAALRDDLANKNSTIQIIVTEKSELQSKSSYLEEQCRLVLQEKELMNQEMHTLKQTCQDLRSKMDEKHSAGTQVQELNIQQIKLQNELEDRVSENHELQGKLRRVVEEQAKEKSLMKNLESELEINKVHLIQLRNTGGETSTQEIKNLNAELATTRASLTTALASRDKLAGDRDKLAEQYRNYSKDLAIQAERLSEQLRRYQEENARLVQRESGLVNQIEQMEKQMQKYVQGGKNVTEEENSSLKDRCTALEAEARHTKEANNKLQQMYTERSDQVEEMMKRLTQKEAKVIELQGRISGLETTNEMLKSESGIDRNKAEFLAAMESDKVAASRAMQQNAKLKLEIEELQRELVNLINSKAEVLDQLEDHKRKVESLSGAEGQIKGLQEAIREREVTISTMRNQIKYLENEINKETDRETVSVGGEVYAELTQAREYIRSLNSVNSELRSQMEVLSSRTRECSESRSPSARERSHSGGSLSSGAEDSTFSSSSDSFVEVTQVQEKSSAKSSDSFIQVPSSLAAQSPELVNNQSADITRSADLLTPVGSQLGTVNGESPLSPPDNLDAWRQLEKRFITAMNRVAALSSDKEQLEHLVTRLQDETETITDYIIMYQHQRKQQKIKIQEKDIQLQQLSTDKEKLQTKLADLHGLVDRLVNDKQEPCEEASETPSGVDGERSPRSTGSPGPDTEKIYQLLSEIQADSEHMVNNIENFQPYFFDNNNGKVMTV